MKKIIAIKPVERKTSELKYHHDSAPGQRFLFIDESLCSYSPLYIALRKVNAVPENQIDYIDQHLHSVDSLYLFIGNNSDMTGLKAIVRINEVDKIISSPETVLIPKDTRHSYKLISGSGFFLSILLDGNFNKSTYSTELVI